MSTDVEKRLYAHNNLPKGWTRSFRPWRLLYQETFELKSEALKREKEMKSHQGRIFIRERLLNQQ